MTNISLTSFHPWDHLHRISLLITVLLTCTTEATLLYMVMVFVLLIIINFQIIQQSSSYSTKYIAGVVKFWWPEQETYSGTLPEWVYCKFWPSSIVRKECLHILPLHLSRPLLMLMRSRASVRMRVTSSSNHTVPHTQLPRNLRSRKKQLL